MSQSILQSIRESTFWVSLSKLRRQGHRKISVLTLQKIHELIELAVEEALAERSQVDASERFAVEGDVQERFQALLAEHQRLLADQDTILRERDELLRRMDLLREEHWRAQEALRKETERHETASTSMRMDAQEMERLEEKLRSEVQLVLRQEMGALEGKPPLNGDWAHRIEKKISSGITGILGAHWDSVREKEKVEHEKKIELLERRIYKLKETLANTEEALDRVSRAKGIDPGIASVFRAVQGLDASDPLRQKKAGLLKEVFEQNLALRQQMNEQIEQGVS